MNPQDKPLLDKYTNAAKKIIYDAGRMKQFLQMLGSKEGALTAVHTVMSMIEKVKPIPPQIAPQLGVNIYVLMVDVAQAATSHKPDPKIIKEVVGTILKSAGGQKQNTPQNPAAAPMQNPVAPAQSQGLIGQQMGVPA